jgi:hypothetical protein
MCARALAVLTASVLAALVAAAALGGSPATSLRPRHPPGGGYSVNLPPTWRFADASYPSDHATHLWFDPANALRKMLVVVSACVGCATVNADGRTPNPRGVVPAGPVSSFRVNRWKAGFLGYSTDDPYPARGWVIVLRRGRDIEGYVTVQLWLPKAENGVATRILNSFRTS